MKFGVEGVFCRYSCLFFPSKNMINVFDYEKNF